MAEIPESASHDIAALNNFPPCTWTQTATWWREQARCFDDLATEAAAGVDPQPRCTGEEMALHLILQRARAIATDPTDIRADRTAVDLGVLRVAGPCDRSSDSTSIVGLDQPAQACCAELIHILLEKGNSIVPRSRRPRRRMRAAEARQVGTV